MSLLPSDLAAMILGRLGPAARQREVTVGGRRYPLFEAPATLAELPRVVEDTPPFRDRDVRLFLSLGGAVLTAAPGLPPADIVELCEVGVHNGDPEDWRRVRDLVSPLLDAFEGDVVFADPAGLDVRFRAPIPAAEARRLDTTLLDALEGGDHRLLDSYTFMLDEASRLGLAPDPEGDPRGGGRVPAFIAQGRLLLWWD